MLLHNFSLPSPALTNFNQLIMLGNLPPILFKENALMIIIVEVTYSQLHP
jgi:hypothetical protein